MLQTIEEDNIELSVFKKSGFEIRGGIINEEPYFVAMDIASVLGYTDTATMTRRLDDSEKGMQNLQTLGGMQNVVIINESGLYNAIFGSKKEESLQFKKWVTSEVLPSIRKNGIYATTPTLENMINNPDFAIELLQTLKREQETRREVEFQKRILDEQIIKDKPLVSFATSVEASVNSVLIRDWVKSISNTIKEKDAREWLRNKGYMYKDKKNKWCVSADKTSRKYFEAVPTTNSNHKGVHVNYTIKITGQGQIALTNKLLDEV